MLFAFYAVEGFDTMRMCLMEAEIYSTTQKMLRFCKKKGFYVCHYVTFWFIMFVDFFYKCLIDGYCNGSHPSARPGRRPVHHGVIQSVQSCLVRLGLG